MKAATAKEAALAGAIRKGLAAPSVMEDCSAIGIGKTDAMLFADVIGLAYIGALGTEQASEVSEEVFDGILLAKEYDETEDEILHVPRGFLSQLGQLHDEGEVTASEIARQLESGELVIE